MGLMLFVLLCFLALPAAGQQPPGVAAFPSLAPVTWERLRAAEDEPQNWLMYSGTFDSQRFSRLNQIDRRNVHEIELKWAYQIPSVEVAETTPLVVDGVMFITEPSNAIVALDAATGSEYWRYAHDLPDDLRLCCGRHNRGLAILGQTLYMGTLDARLIAVDAHTGDLLWNVEVGDYRDGYSKTAAPLVVKDRIVTGVAGADFGIRGFLDSYDPDTGARLWRTYTIPGPDDPGAQTWSGDSWRTGGSPTWLTGSYDPDLDLVYWGTGNPAPSYYGDVRRGDNLYTDSALALDPDTGMVSWHFQFTPHDVHQWDANQIPVLADIDFGGTSRPALLWANRNGFYYTLDRQSGSFLLGRPFARQTWAAGLDENGRPIQVPTNADTPISPPSDGATNWMSPTYSPLTGLLYVMSFDGAATFVRGDQYTESNRHVGGFQWTRPAADSGSTVRAIDPSTGDLQWEYDVGPQAWSGLLATAGDLVFGGSTEGSFYALDAETGDELWSVSVIAPVRAAPISYAVDTDQYVAIAVGNVVYSFGLRSQRSGSSSAQTQIQGHLARQLTRNDYRRVAAAWATAASIPASDMGSQLRVALVEALNRETASPEPGDEHLLASLSDKALAVARLPDQEVALSMAPVLARFPVNGWQVSEVLVSLGDPALCEVVRTITAAESTDFMLWGALGTLERFVDDWGQDRLRELILDDECFVTDRVLGHSLRARNDALHVIREIASAFLRNGSEYLPLTGTIGLAIALRDEELRMSIQDLATSSASGLGRGLSAALARNLQRIARERLVDPTPPWKRQ